MSQIRNVIVYNEILLRGKNKIILEKKNAKKW